MASLKERGTGRTTNIILDSVKSAIQVAGKPYHCYDHERGEFAHTRDCYVAKQVSNILITLNVEHLLLDNVVEVTPRVKSKSL